jgi:hypothetical protein
MRGLGRGARVGPDLNPELTLPPRLSCPPVHCLSDPSPRPHAPSPSHEIIILRRQYSPCVSACAPRTKDSKSSGDCRDKLVGA